MVEPSSFYNRLSNREGFNASVRHIQSTLDLLDSCGTKKNLADEINALLEEKEILSESVSAAANMLLVEKWGYRNVSRNIADVPSDPAALVAEISKWKALDIIFGYHHPDLGFIVINPKNPDSISILGGLRRNELLIVYAGTPEDKKVPAELLDTVIELCFRLIENRSCKVPPALRTGPFVFVAPKPVKSAAKKKVSAAPRNSGAKKAQSEVNAHGVKVKPVVATSTGYSYSAGQEAVSAQSTAAPGRARMSSLVSVSVTNELFHNGNVEAWKRIIRSFNAKYPDLQVNVYYDGERIVDINTLFKWGKVKHGSVIQFSVSGDNIQDLAKLSRYFRQGASPSFEAFLHGSPDTVMNLF